MSLQPDMNSPGELLGPLFPVYLLVGQPGDRTLRISAEDDQHDPALQAAAEAAARALWEFTWPAQPLQRIEVVKAGAPGADALRLDPGGILIEIPGR